MRCKIFLEIFYKRNWIKYEFKIIKKIIEKLKRKRKKKGANDYVV